MAVFVRRDLGGGASLERLRSVVGTPRPASLRDMMARNAEDVVLAEPLITGDGIPLGGAQSIRLSKSGAFRFEGHFNASGAFSFDVALSTRIIGANGFVLTLAAHGEVHGTNEPGDRKFPWLQEDTNALIAANWPALRHARIEHDLQFDTDIFGTAGDVLGFLAKAAVASTVAGAAGLVVVLGTEAVSALGLQELVLPGLVGVAVAGGVLLVFGPGAIIPAFVAGAAAGVAVEQLVRQRRLTDEELAFADKVYRGTLPRERIVLTNLTGTQGRPFTIPAPGNAILVNLGDGFGDPVGYTGDGDGPTGVRAAGQLLIHELAHAWQITHSTFLPGTMCNGIANQLGTLGGDMSVYHYGPAGPRWDSFNLEQQGSVVDEWFAGRGEQSPFGAMREDPANPYFRYIRDNVRAGVL
jgi:hypothetical protein